MTTGMGTIDGRQIHTNDGNAGRASEDEDSSSLTTEEIHTVLSNSRRRGVLEQLRESDEKLTARELSERIAEIESDESPAPRNKRNSVYVSLHQTHLPKLEDLGIVEYHTVSKQVELRDQAADVFVYMETVPKYGLAWSEVHAGIALLGLLTMAGAHVGVPMIVDLSVAGWGVVALVVIVLTAAIQTYLQGSSIIHRLRSSERT